MSTLSRRAILGSGVAGGLLTAAAAEDDPKLKFAQPTCCDSGGCKLCTGCAREFVLRIVPELAYVYSLLPQLYDRLFIFEMAAPVALTTIGAAVREGFDLPEKIALRQIRAGRLNRVDVHRQYIEITPYITGPVPPVPEESFPDVLDRVRRAADLYDALQ